MDPSHSSCWDSILEKVKPLIPTIDFDSSSCECEEIAIYQRPAGFSLKVPEDFESFSTDEDDLEPDACEEGVVKLNEAELYASLNPNKPNQTRSEEHFPPLSFVPDQWDLGDGLPLQQHVSVKPAKTHADSDEDRPQGDIMEKLVALCNMQSSKSVSEPVKGLNHVRHNNVWNKPPGRMAADLQRNHQERPTVYIDLRCPDPSIKPPRTSPNLSSESKSPARHNTPREIPPAKKTKREVHTGSWMGDREVTGKSMLLQKIREMNRTGNKYPTKYAEPPYSVRKNDAEELKEKLPQSESTCRLKSLHLWEDKRSPNAHFESKHPKMENPLLTQRSATVKPKRQSDQQRQKARLILLHKQRQQILKQLEIHRPTKSATQKQPAAEGTEVLYDFEASHLPSMSALPAAAIEHKGCMLLMVNLASPGMVGGRPHGRRKHLYPAATKSHIYNTLVAWFLSLVGPDPRHDEDEVGAEVPFWVAGLQQLWTKNGLALHVLAVARHCYTPTKRDIHAPFYNHVCRFLSETSLAVIADKRTQQAYALSVHLPPSYLNSFISATSNQKIIDGIFAVSPGFYWQTVETQECVCKGRETTAELHTEVSVLLGCKLFFTDPLITHYTLQLVLHSGLDVCGLRLLYPPQQFLSDSAGAVPVVQRTDEIYEPVLALAVRGPHAHSVLKDLTRSLDPLQPTKTGPTSLNPLHCRGQQPSLLYPPPLATEVHRELCLWFSGRLQGEGAQDHNQPLNGALPSDDRGSPFSISRSPSFLCATTKADLLLMVSSVVPPCCYAQVLAVCERRGFGLMGLQRLQLQSNGAAVLGLSIQQALVFCGPHSVTLDQEEQELPSRCLVLLLRKENAMHHSVSLPAALMREFKAQNLLGYIQCGLDGVHAVQPSFCFHTVPYSSNLFKMFVKCMWAVPDPSNVILSHQKHSSTSNMEQVVILTLCGKDMSQGLSLLHTVLTEGAGGDIQHAKFKLLGLKFLPALTRLQAQELSPYEVGEQLCHDSLDSLLSSPALVCALKRVGAFASLRKFLPGNYPSNLSVLMSPTPEVAFRQASLFFFEHEMIPDPQVLLTMCLFKPRIWTHALGKIGRTLQLSGLTLVGLRVVTLNERDATSLLPAENEPHPSDLEAHVEYMCSGSSLALCLKGENAVRRLLDVLGQEDSSLWTTCYGKAHSYNGIYASGSYKKAVQDVKRFFPEGLCCTETSMMRQEQILSLCSDPIASVEREKSCRLATVAQEGSLIRSARWQMTCLLIPLNAPPPSQVPSQLDMLEQLLRSGCHLVAGRMSILDAEQRNHIAGTLKVSSTGNETMAHLSLASCLIVALQGETVVTCINSILDSIYKKRSDLEKVGNMIIYPESEKEAKQLIEYLFDALSPESCHNIVP
uniref:dynein axonemal assembly factor 8 isoform X2 n=1 Tax=Scatophagus argus TaxID=75038 RepID=UPI001ED7D264|nr:dynein axonemal assembly factor 8 isoform X2 [Scatophagus argus]